MTDSPLNLAQFISWKLRLLQRPTGVGHARASHAEPGFHSASAPSDVDRKPVPRVELRLSNDGRGFEPTGIRPGHRGLSIICERASAIGADLTIRSRPDQGAEIVVIWEERQ